MILILEPGHTRENIDTIVREIENLGFKADISTGANRSVIGVIGDVSQVATEHFEPLDGVERVIRASRPYKLVSREYQPETTRVQVGDFEFGGDKVGVIAGPCTVESREQMIETARRVKDAGAVAIRGGAFKPRTSPYSFRGLGEEGLKILAEARDETGLGVVTEVMTPEDVPLVEKYADVLQVGARNIQNYHLLEAVGRASKPVLLKRGLSSSAEELLLCAEYIVKEGNKKVMLCERGVRTFETYARNTLTLSIVPFLKEETHLPVIVDPSHGTGERPLVSPMCYASVAAGADGLLVEVHYDPSHALVDGHESLTCEMFAQAMRTIRRVAEAVGRGA